KQYRKSKDKTLPQRHGDTEQKFQFFLRGSVALWQSFPLRVLMISLQRHEESQRGEDCDAWARINAFPLGTGVRRIRGGKETVEGYVPPGWRHQGALHRGRQRHAPPDFRSRTDDDRRSLEGAN